MKFTGLNVWDSLGSNCESRFSLEFPLLTRRYRLLKCGTKARIENAVQPRPKLAFTPGLVILQYGRPAFTHFTPVSIYLGFDLPKVKANLDGGVKETVILPGICLPCPPNFVFPVVTRFPKYQFCPWARARAILEPRQWLRIQINPFVHLTHFRRS
jgi:hypothetical protein